MTGAEFMMIVLATILAVLINSYVGVSRILR